MGLMFEAQRIPYDRDDCPARFVTADELMTGLDAGMKEGSIS